MEIASLGFRTDVGLLYRGLGFEGTERQGLLERRPPGWEDEESQAITK